MSISASTDDEVDTYLRTEVVSPPLPVRLRRELRTRLRIVVIGDIVDDECAFLAHSINRQRTRSGGLHRANGSMSKSLQEIVK